MANVSVSFIGAGNLAWHLAPALDNMGFVVKEVCSRNSTSAKELTKQLYQAEVKTTLDFSSSTSRVFIIAVADDAIQEVAQDLVLPDDAILLHTSGSQPLSTLGYAATENIGVFYPLQTFTKTKKVDFKSIPIFVECETADTEKICLQMAKKISADVHKIGSRERKALHVAAVFASNFTNHMLTVSKDLLQQNKLDFELLKPLISETLNKSLAIGPENAQTGPAKRGDYETLDHHFDFLSHDEALSTMYKVISQHIIDRYEIE